MSEKIQNLVNLIARLQVIVRDLLEDEEAMKYFKKQEEVRTLQRTIKELDDYARLLHKLES